MTNEELSLKFESIIVQNNFFDQVQALAEFEKEYKTSDFYKATKMSLKDVYKNYASYRLLRYGVEIDLGKAMDDIQNLINNLNLDNLEGLLGKVETIFSNENEQIQKDFESIQPALDYYRRANRKEEEINKNAENNNK